MFHLPCEQTDACEIITFSQMYLQVVIKFDQHEIKAVTKNKWELSIQLVPQNMWNQDQKLRLLDLYHIQSKVRLEIFLNVLNYEK